MEDLCDAMLALLTKEYEYHMIDFLIDAQNHFGMTEDDFTFLKDNVLLILSEDDHTFQSGLQGFPGSHYVPAHGDNQYYRRPSCPSGETGPICRSGGAVYFGTGLERNLQVILC